MVYSRGAQIFQKPSSHLKILGSGRVTRSKFNTEGPQIFGVNLQNAVTTTTWLNEICTPLVYWWSCQ